MTGTLEPPDVSVIVIACDVREEVMACLASIEAHSEGLSVETILVDNGSTDGTAPAVRETFPSAHLVALETNEGVPARNHGLRHARGRFRMFLDSDALVTPGALRTMVDALESDRSVGLIGPKLIYPDGGLQLSTRRYPPFLLPLLRRPPLARFFDDGPTIRHHLMADDSHEHRRTVEYVLGACQMFRAEAQAGAGEIDSHIWYGPDDADWCFAVREAGWSVLYLPEAEVVHDYRRSSVGNPISKLALRQLVAHFYFQAKWLRRRKRLIAEGRSMDAAAAPPPALALKSGPPNVR